MAFDEIAIVHFSIRGMYSSVFICQLVSEITLLLLLQIVTVKQLKPMKISMTF